MELKNNKSAIAALATLGVTAIAAGTTAFIKIRKKRRQKLQQEKEKEEQTRNSQGKLTPEQQMVYNDAIRDFLTLNNRIFELRILSRELQPIIQWLATDGQKPATNYSDERLNELCYDIQKFLINQVPFINACINTISDDGTTYADYINAAVGTPYDPTLNIEYNGTEVQEGSTVKSILKLGYFFPESRIANHPVKSIVLV